MSKLIGEVKVFKSTEKQYEERKYYTCLGMDKDNEIYKFSAPYEDHPDNGDVYQMEMSPSEKDLRPYIRFVKVK